jgi:hypothetical protein
MHKHLIGSIFSLTSQAARELRNKLPRIFTYNVDTSVCVFVSTQMYGNENLGDILYVSSVIEGQILKQVRKGTTI